MKKQSVLLLCILLTLYSGALGCSKDPKKGNLISQKLQTPTYYKNIPADTPYFFSDMMPLQYEKLNYNIYSMYSPLLASLRQEMVREQQNLPPDTINMEQRAVLAVLDELDGNFSPDGLSKLGINARGSFALYGVGMWPVMRIPISDKAKFEAMLKRVETKVGKTIPTQTYKGVTFREFSDPKVSLPMVLTKDAFIVGLTSKTFRSTYLDYALGKVPATKNMMATNKLLAVQKRHKYKPYMTGYVDLAGLSTALIGQDPNNLIYKSVADIPDFKMNLSADCKTEYLQIVKSMPRMVMGYREVTPKSMSVVTGWEVTNDLAKNFVPTKAPVPLNGTAMTRDAMGWAGVGVDVSKLIGVMKIYSERLKTAPYKCAHLGEFNNVPRAYNQISSLPTVVKSIKGASLVVGNVDLDLKNNKVNDLAVAVVVRTTDPQGLFQTAKLTLNLPSMQSINPKTDGKPVELPLPAQITGMIPSLPKAYVVMTADAMGLAIGTANAEKLAAALKQPLVKEGDMAIMSYDVQKILKTLKANTANANMSESERAMFNSMLSVYANFGPSTMGFDVTPAGFFVTGRATFTGAPKK